MAAAPVKFCRTLKVGDRGRDVWAIQRALRREAGSSWSLPPGVVWPNAVFGEHTRQKVRAFQSGHHLRVDGQVGPETLAALAPSFDAYGRAVMLKVAIDVAKARAQQATDPTLSMRTRMLAACWVTYRNRWRIHYTQASPWRMIGVIRRILSPDTPLTSDCSGRHAWHCFTSGAEDPSGFGFDGWGFTGSFREWANVHGLWTHDPQCGDQAHYGPGSGRHVVTYLKDGMGMSHGSDPVAYLPIYYRNDFYGFVRTRPR